MLIFDQLRISDDGKKLFINAHVNTASYFENIAIDKITIMTADKVSETDPGIPTEDYLYTETFSGAVRNIAIVLTIDDLNGLSSSDMSKTLFFIYVKCKGIPNANTPCRLDEETTLGVTFDENMLYQKVMSFTKQIVSECDVPLSFIDFILQWNTFKAAIETEHYLSAIEHFNTLFDIVDTPENISKGCNCYG